MNKETLEILAATMYYRQRDYMKNRDGINGRRLWRSTDVSDLFWDGYVRDVQAVIAKYTELRNEEAISLGFQEKNNG